VAEAPAISVIMPVHNGVATLDRAVASLIGQAFPDWELIAVDDASTDDSYGRLQAWGERDRRIHVFQSNENRGPSAARNLALTHATADRVAYLDCDDEFYPDFLAHAHRLRDRADVLIFGYDYLADEDDPSQAQTWDPTPFGPLFFEQNISTPIGVAHKRELWSRVGGFDESLWCQEDWDFWKRLARTGADVLYIPIRSGLYRFRHDSRSQSPRVTPDQRAAYDAARMAGRPLYGPPNRSSRRHPVQKVAFAAPYLYLDPSHPASVAASGILELLSRSGFTCQAYCGAGAVAPGFIGIESFLDRQGLPCQSSDSRHGPFAARLIFARKADVPMTLVQPYATGRADPDKEIVASFLAFYESFLDRFQPDVLLTHCVNPNDDPLVRLAKRRDIPVVVPLLDFPYRDRMAFHNIDYCLVASEASRRRYWEESGLACVALPPPDTPDVGPVYAEFFRTLHPQPGPPFVPG
jgi:hypothetical protein